MAKSQDLNPTVIVSFLRIRENNDKTCHCTEAIQTHSLQLHNYKDKVVIYADLEDKL